MSKIIAICVNKVHFNCKNASKIDIITYDISDYKKVKEAIKMKNVNYFTYTLKEEKHQCYVIKGIHHSTEPKSISDELDAMECMPIIVKNMTKSILVDGKYTRVPADMFQVNFGTEILREKFLSIKFLCNFKISWEPKKRSAATQCRRCQRFGHSATNCNMAYRCVKCDNTTNHGPGGHCPKKIDDNPFCINCKGMHPANHLKCKVRTDYISKVSLPKPIKNSTSKNTNSRSNPPVTQPPNKSHPVPNPPDYSIQSFPMLPTVRKANPISVNHIVSPPTHFVREAVAFSNIVSPVSPARESSSASDSKTPKNPKNIYDFFNSEVNDLFGCDLVSYL